MGSALLSFLSRARTLAEIAEHLNMPLDRAEKLVIEEVESGRVLLSPVSQTVVKGRELEPQGGWKASLTFSGSTAVSGREETRLPKTGTPKVGSQIGFGTGRLPKLRTARPATVIREQSQPSVSELLGEKPSRVTGRGYMSSSVQAGLLEAMEKGPKSLMELRAQFEVTRDNLDRMVKRGILEYSWGPRGVGLSFAATEKGRRQLDEFRAAMLEIRKLAGKKLISAKSGIPF